MKTFIKDLKIGQNFDSQFVLVDFQVKNKRDGGQYFALEVMDKSGAIKGNMWDNFLGLVGIIHKNDIVAVSGVVQDYNGKKQISVGKMQKLDPEQVNMADFVATTKADIEKMWADVSARIEKMKNTHLRILLKGIFDAERTKAFKAAPAAKALHNAYRGGLLEHVHSLLLLSEKIHEHYGSLGIKFDLELLQTGILLHDLMKTEELNYALGIDYADVGQLVGHLPMALQLVERYTCRMPDFPPQLKMHLDHVILSHHGELEFGSPIIPRTIEAIVMSNMDMLDSRMWGYQAVFDRKDASSDWSDNNRMFETSLYLKGTFA